MLQSKGFAPVDLGSLAAGSWQLAAGSSRAAGRWAAPDLRLAD
jgi:hypothetical protein